MTNARKPILCIDFDGVIHDYREGWKDGSIYGKVMPDFFDWAAEAKDRFKLVVYSSRSKTPEGIAAMMAWLTKEGEEWAVPASDGSVPSVVAWFEFASEKPPAFLTIDDRALCFGGNWSDPRYDPHRLTQFKTWSQE